MDMLNFEGGRLRASTLKGLFRITNKPEPNLSGEPHHAPYSYPKKTECWSNPAGIANIALAVGNLGFLDKYFD